MDGDALQWGAMGAYRAAGWAPLLAGDVRERALATVQEIAAALPAPDDLKGPDLAEGSAGVALFYCYLSEWRSEGDAERCAAHLNRAIRAVAAGPLPASLYGGLAGIAWAAQHIRSRFNPGAQIEHEALDEVLATHVSRIPERGNYDLISGLAGLGIYAIERLPRPAARALLERVIDRLEGLAQRTDAGSAWFTAPESMAPEQRELCPEGYYNLGLAHGAPGVIALLGMACGAGVAVGRARTLLDAAVRWLLAQRLPEGAGGCFGHWLAPGKEHMPTRCAWCYGDPGASIALLLAARAVGGAWWEPDAIRVAHSAIARPPDQAGVRDAGLCHGSIGLAHIYNRLYQATADPSFAEAARYWIALTLDFRRTGKGTAGFQPYRIIARTQAEPTDTCGFLMGAAGIGLALLAACGSQEPDWDRVLLTSVPPQHTAHAFVADG